MDPGNLRTHIHVGVGGAHGTIARARSALHIGDLGFEGKPRERETSRPKRGEAARGGGADPFLETQEILLFSGACVFTVLPVVYLLYYL